MTDKKIPRSNVSAYIKKYLQLCIGAVIAALGLELFLIPNEVIDGGVVGLSSGVFLIAFNIPFLWLLTKKSAKISWSPINYSRGDSFD